MVRIAVESGFGAHIDDATLCWVYDLRWWGLCGQGHDEASAFRDLHDRALPSYRAFLRGHGDDCPDLDDLTVAERIHGDEQAFDLDRAPATDGEVERTLTLLRLARQDLHALLDEATDAELDWDDPDRRMPAWARWRTLRQMAWHLADTESRYYLAALGRGRRERADDLHEELPASHGHVVDTVPRLDPELVVEAGGEVWTTRKLLRRLAWHERSELDAMQALLRRARARAR